MGRGSRRGGGGDSRRGSDTGSGVGASVGGSRGSSGSDSRSNFSVGASSKDRSNSAREIRRREGAPAPSQEATAALRAEIANRKAASGIDMAVADVEAKSAVNKAVSEGKFGNLKERVSPSIVGRLANVAMLGVPSSVNESYAQKLGVPTNDDLMSKVMGAASAVASLAGAPSLGTGSKALSGLNILGVPGLSSILDVPGLSSIIGSGLHKAASFVRQQPSSGVGSQVASSVRGDRSSGGLSSMNIPSKSESVVDSNLSSKIAVDPLGYIRDRKYSLTNRDAISNAYNRYRETSSYDNSISKGVLNGR